MMSPSYNRTEDELKMEAITGSGVMTRLAESEDYAQQTRTALFAEEEMDSDAAERFMEQMMARLQADVEEEARRQEEIDAKLAARSRVFEQEGDVLVAEPEVVTPAETPEEPKIALPVVNESFSSRLAQMEQENLAAQLRELPKRAEQEKEEEHISAPLSKTSKLVISVYAVGIVALILLIVLNALAISSLSVSNTALQAQVVAKQQEVAALAETLSQAGSNEAILQRAEELGMVSADGQSIVIDLGTAQASQAEGATNWFDWICDFVSSLFI